MWWNQGAKCPTFPGVGEGPSVGKVLGQAVQGLGNGLEVFACYVALCCSLHSRSFRKGADMFVSINHLVIGKRALWVAPAFMSVKNSCSGKALGKLF